MNGPAVVVAIPFVAAVLLAFVPDWRLSRWLNLGASALVFVASLALFSAPLGPRGLLHLDGLNTIFVALTAFVATSTAWFSAGYIGVEVAHGRLDALRLRFYHAMYQGLLGAMVLALLADNLGLMWVAVELATITTVPMVGLYRTHASIEAAWKFFILCGVGIALALFGTIVLYLAATQVLGPGLAAMTWTSILPIAPRMNGALLNLAFVFLLVGYGTKAGLVPLHGWLPDAHAEGPTAISAVLSGLVLNVALSAVLRTRMLLAGNEDAIAPGPLMIGMGLASLALAAFSLWRRRDVKRLFGWSSIEHMGIATFAFGLGGPAANYAGLIHMVGHSLTKSAIFFAVGTASQAKGSQRIEDITGLSITHPALGWGLVLMVAAIVGLPPFMLFTSELLIAMETIARQPWLTVPLASGIIVALAALVTRMQGLCFGAATPDAHPAPRLAAVTALYAHMVLIVWLGLAPPDGFVAWFHAAAWLLG